MGLSAEGTYNLSGSTYTPMIQVVSSGTNTNSTTRTNGVNGHR